jgi:hypothetical protein
MRCIGPVLAAALLLLPVSAQADLLVTISKSQQRLSVQVDGSEAYRWTVSTGRPGYSTPSGSFQPIRLERDWYSHKYDMAPMPWSVFFQGGYAVHGTMESRRLGRAVSHGCVRLRPDHAATLYALVQREGAEHTRIVVLDGPLPGAPRPALDARVAKLPPPRPAIEAPPARDRAVKPALVRAEPPSAPLARHTRKSVKPAPSVTVRHASLHERVRHAWGSPASEEARVLREREAWLRSLDRKYGITR